MFDALATVMDAVRDGFGGRKIVVVGDLMLDRYWLGNVRRISPEAPVPVVHCTGRRETAGGSANVAANLAGLGLSVSVCGVVGDDEDGHCLARLLKDASVDTSGIVWSQRRGTITKARILGGRQQMLRLDFEDSGPLESADARAVETSAATLLSKNTSAVVLSDYAKGVLFPSFCKSLILEAKKADCDIFVDPKGTNYAKYTGATTLTPNWSELSAATGVGTDHEAGLLDAGERLREQLKLRYLVVTRGEHGMTLLRRGQRLNFPAVAQEVFDVSGAGDTALSALVAASVSGIAVPDALKLANVAAGIVVGKAGTVPIGRQELFAKLASGEASSLSVSKVCRESELNLLLRDWRDSGKKVVFTNGCFDVLHLGHVRLLERARGQGHRLIVALNSDQSIRRLKGNGRPIVGESDRAQVIAALESVDAVILFNEDTPLRLIEAIRPDVLVKGGDYTPETVVGSSYVASYGGSTVIVDTLPGRSTSSIVDRMLVG